MKKIDYIIALAAATVLTACSSGSDAAADYSSDPDAVAISASVGNIVSSRSNPVALTGESATAFRSSDVTAVSNDGGSAFVQYTLGTDGTTWTPASSTFLRWDTETMPFEGYYPATAGTSMTVFTVPADQSEYHTSTAKDIALADWMTCSTSCTRPSGGSAVQLAFTRKMARVIFKIGNINNQFGTTTPAIANVKIFGQTATDGTISGVTPYAVTTSAVTGNTYTALLLPSAAAANSEIFFSLAADGFPLSLTGIPAMEAGKSYTYNITLGKNALYLSSVEVADWLTGSTISSSASVTGKPLYVTSNMTITDAMLTNAITDDGTIMIRGIMSDTQMSAVSTYVKAHSAVKHINMSYVINSEKYTVKGIKNLSNAFTNSALVSATLPLGTINIDNAFKGCTNLTSVTLGTDSIASAASAFEGCTKLTSVKLGRDSLASAAFAFKGCTSLTEIHLEASKFKNVESYSLVQGGTTEHVNPFQGFDASAATLYLNASQAANITATTTCSWEPLGKGKTGSGNNCQEPIDLSGFKAVYCGTTKVYGN